MQCWIDDSECETQVGWADAGVLHIKEVCGICSVLVSNQKEIIAIFKQAKIELDLVDPDELLISVEDQEFLQYMSPEIVLALSFIAWVFDRSGDETFEEVEPEDIEALKEIFRLLSKQIPEIYDK